MFCLYVCRYRVTKWLPEADKRLSQARAFTSSGNYPFWSGFLVDMNVAAQLFSRAELGLLARRVRSTRNKCLKAWRQNPHDIQKQFDAAWQQFDELNARDHFVYSTKQSGKAQR